MSDGKRKKRQEGTVQSQFDAIIAKTNDGIVIRTDAESSQLSSAELLATEKVYNDLKEHYGTTLETMGGVDAIIVNFEKYLIDQIGGDPELRNDKNLYDDSNARALRAILDPAPGARFSNLLHKDSNEQCAISSTNSVPFREILAYYWLAASDNNMLIPEEMLSEDHITKENAVSTAKLLFTMKIAEIRTAHNEDNGMKDILYKKNIDQPSCPPGTLGRLARSVVYNPLAAISSSRAAEFPRKIEGFIISQLRLLPSEQKTKIADLITAKYFIGDEDEDISAEQKKALSDFVDEISKIKSTFIHILQKDYKNLSEVDLAAAQQMFDISVNSIDLIRVEAANPTGSLMDGVRKICEEPFRESEKQKAKDKYAADFIAAVNKEKQQLEALVLSVNSISFTNLATEELEMTLPNIDKQYGEVLAARDKTFASLVAQAMQDYQIALDEKYFVHSADEIQELMFAAYPPIKETIANAIDVRNAYERAMATAKEKYEEVHAKQIAPLIQQFFEEQNNVQSLVPIIAARYDAMTIIYNEIDEVMVSINADRSYDMEKITQQITTVETDTINAWQQMQQQFEAYCKTKQVTATPKELVKFEQQCKERFGTFLKTAEGLLNDKKNALKNLDTVHKAYKAINDIANIFNNGVDLQIIELTKGNPKKGMKSFAQLEVLKNTKDSLEPLLKNKLYLLKDEACKAYAEAVQKVMLDTEEKLNDVGYPGKFSDFMHKIKQICAKVVKSIFAVEINVSHRITKEQVKKQLLFSDKKLLLSNLENGVENAPSRKFTLK